MRRFLFHLLLFIPILSVQFALGESSNERAYFDQYWEARYFSVPKKTISSTLTDEGTVSSIISVDANDTIAKVLPTQFGVNTPFRNGNQIVTDGIRIPIYQQAQLNAYRFPAGSGSNKYFWDGNIPNEFQIEVSGIDGTRSANMTPEIFTDFIDTLNSQATVVVNYFYARYGVTPEGTRAARVQQAADYAAGFVRRMNIELGANIKNWEIGNECYGKWEEGWDVNGSIVTGKEYGEDFRVFAEAMKAVDPTIKVGVVVTREDDDWNSGVLPEVKDHADFLVVHNYFTSEKDGNPETILGSIDQVGTIHNTLQQCVEKYTGKSKDYFPIAMTEFNCRSSYNCTMVNGMFTTQVLGELVKNGYGLASLWVSEWKWNADVKESKGFLAKNDPDQPDYSPRQSYMPFHFYGKCFGDHMLQAASNNNGVNVYASRFANGEFGLVVINTTSTEKTFRLDINNSDDISDYSQAYWYEFYANSINIGDKKFYINGQTGTTSGGGPADFQDVPAYKAEFVNKSHFKAKKYSVNFIVLAGGKTDKPEFSQSGSRITISSNTPGATIYYTLDGSDPDETSSKYEGPFHVPAGSVVKAVAYKQGMTASEINEFSVKYNVLMIAIDDLKPVLNCYGESQIKSPNMDRLADQGVIFTRAYCQWSVCGPSRASLLAGQTPDGTGIRNLKSQMRVENPSLVTLPEYFKNNGFQSAACGKVFDPRNVDEGHDLHSWTIPYTDPGDYSYPVEYGNFVQGNAYRVTENTASERGPAGVDDDGYQDGQICLDALAKLDQFAENPDQQFFLAVGFKKPHIPFVAPRKYWDLYNREEIDLAAFQRPAAGSPEYSYHTPEPMGYVDIPDPWTYDDVERGNDILDPDDQRKLIHGYYACVSYIDAQVGKLLDKLSDKGLDDNTVILLFGDHGYHLGDHKQWGKHTNFEHSVRAPLIVSIPGGEKHQYDSPVEFTDIYPTLCDLSGVGVPAKTLQGTSLAPAVQGSNQSLKSCAVSEYRTDGHSGYSFRTERYRLSLWFDGSNFRPDVEAWNENRISDIELYDYESDPLETENLASKSEYNQALGELKQIAADWWKSQYDFFHQQTEQSLSIPYIEHFENYNEGASLNGDFWFSENSLWDRIWKGNYVTSYSTNVVNDSPDGSRALKFTINTKNTADGGSVFKLRTNDLTEFGDDKTYLVSYYARTDVEGVGVARMGADVESVKWNNLTADYKEYFDTVEMSNGKLFLYFENSLVPTGTEYNVWIDNLKISNAPVTSVDKPEVVEADGVVVYPNPVDDRLKIDSNLKIEKVRVFDLAGKCLIHRKNKSEYLEVDKLNRGVYLLVINTLDKVISRRFVKR